MPTYNHENYIEQAIKSFLMQKCNFACELVISNDCSSDNTLSIAMKYAKENPEKIKLFNQEKNLGLIKNYNFLLEKATGKYIAILESDDYWIDSLKLQKQVDVLEKDTSCGFVYTSANIVDKKDILLSCQQASKCGYIFSDMLRSHFMLAVTICFSREKFDLYCNIQDYIKYNFKTFDHPTLLALSANSKVIALSDITAAHRVLDSSISNNSNYEKIVSFFDSIEEIENYVINKYGTGGLTKKQLLNSQYMRRMIVALRRNKKSEVFKYARKITPDTIKLLIIKYFPLLWIIKNSKKI
jgi:glycosyltransferase involved in cell wall biosynthesis